MSPMVPSQAALDYYREQYDTLGAQLMRLQHELTLARREARRNRTLALLIQQLHAFAQHASGADSFDRDLGEHLLMLMVERFRVDCAALLRRCPCTGGYVVEQGVGIAAGLVLPRPPNSTGLARSAAPAPDAFDRIGVEAELWIEAPPLHWILLVGYRRREGARPEHRLDATDRPIAEAALNFYAGLLGHQAAVRTLHALRDSEANYRALFEGAQDAILVLDLGATTILDANFKAIELFGGPLEELRRQPPGAWLIPSDAVHWKPIWRAALRDQPQCMEAQVTTANERILWAEITLKRIDTRKPLLLAVVRDISARKQDEEAIYRLAFFDPLTNLPNRRLFLDRLAHAQAETQRSGTFGAVLFLDLDRFKHINDARGHQAGDHLLQGVARRLSSLLRESDSVARFGGDEFVMLMPHLTRSANDAPRFARGVAEKIRQAMMKPFQLPEGVVSPETSIGVTIFSGTSATQDDILREADTALYRAKENGRNCVRFFEPAMQEAVEARFTLEHELRQVLERNELVLHYQPQLDTGNCLVGAEALLRWEHPSRGMIPPDRFIALAEETGVIVAIGHWVLTQACQLLGRAARAGHPIHLSVNVSPRQFRQHDFVDQVRRTLVDADVPRGRLVLEITEGVVIDDIQGTIGKLRELKALGALISIDDFGTGFSSLTYLKRLPIDELKIDRSFVRDVCVDADDAALVETIIAVCQRLKVSVVAEGVETAEQHAFLRAVHCDLYQGFLLGRPAPAESLLRRLQESRDAAAECAE